MFRGDGYTKPKLRSLIGTIVVAVLVWIGSFLSSFIGYLVALFCMIMIIVAMHFESIWPTERKPENTLVFSLFWGCMLGALVPFLISVYLEGGLAAVLEIFTSEP